MNSQFIGKLSDAGKDRESKDKRASEDEMAGWHPLCNGHEHGKTSEDGEEHGSLACCSPWCLKVLDMIG